MSRKKMDKFVTIKPDFDEKKTTQAAALILRLNGGSMNYMKLVKLLYNIDREALRRRCYPVTFDDYFSLPHGQVVSKTLDKAENEAPGERTYWDQFIRTRGYNSELVGETDFDELSRFEISLIREMHEQYLDMNQYDMRNEHHLDDRFTEWEDPGDSSIPTSYEKLLSHLGFSEKDMKLFAEDLKDAAFNESLS
jgi:hypothetical protein